MATTRTSRIYVDLDDVLAETALMFLRVLERDFGRRVAFEALHSYHLGESLSLDESQLDDFMEAVHDPEELVGIDPIPGAIETLTEWSRLGYEVFVVTGRPEVTLEASLAWLERHNVPFEEFHFLDKYTATYGDGHHGSKDGLTLADLPEMDFCLAVEDFPGITPHLADELGIPVALFDRPWNRAATSGGNGNGAPVVRCRDWSEIRARFAAP